MRKRQGKQFLLGSLVLRPVNSGLSAFSGDVSYDLPDTEFSLHRVSTFQTRPFSKSHLKNTANNFPIDTNFDTSGEVGLSSRSSKAVPADAHSSEEGEYQRLGFDVDALHCKRLFAISLNRFGADLR